MKRLHLGFIALAFAALLIAGGILRGEFRVEAQKNQKATIVTIDSLGTVGAHVFYQLTDAENGGVFQYSNGSFLRKVPAVVTFDPLGGRGEDGRLVYSIHVFRPGFLGGAFSKDGVSYDPGREPGTIDTIQPSDIYR